MFKDHLICLADAYEAHTGLSHWQVSKAACGSAKFFRDLRKGFRENGSRVGFSDRTYERALGWFSGNWPADLPWPEGVPRPRRVSGRAA